VLGSIVEGSDAEFTCDPVDYPTTMGVIRRALQWLDDEVAFHMGYDEDAGEGEG
jgi:hypothetical protein